MVTNLNAQLLNSQNGAYYLAMANATGTLLAANFPALTGDISTTVGSLNTTLATVNSNIGSYGSASQVGSFTVNAKGLITAASNITITPSAIGAVKNNGGAPSIQEGLYSALPAAGNAGSIYIASDTLQTFRDNGTNWVQISGPGKQTIFMPAVSMLPRKSNGCSRIQQIETVASNANIMTINFDSSLQEYAQFSVSMPKSWNIGTVSFQAIWSHSTTTVNFGVVWGLSCLALGAGENINQAFGTQVNVTTTGGTANYQYISPESAAITPGNSPAQSDTLYFQISRIIADAGDTLAVDARLHGIKIFYTTNLGSDL